MGEKIIKATIQCTLLGHCFECCLNFLEGTEKGDSELEALSRHSDCNFSNGLPGFAGRIQRANCAGIEHRNVYFYIRGCISIYDQAP